MPPLVTMFMLPASAWPNSAGEIPLTMLTSPTDSMLTMSILLIPLYCEICLAPAFALASVPFAVIDMAAPPRPFKRRRMPPPPPLPAPPPSTAPS